jgi:hypothetical protein
LSSFLLSFVYSSFPLLLFFATLSDVFFSPPFFYSLFALSFLNSFNSPSFVSSHVCYSFVFLFFASLTFPYCISFTCSSVCFSITSFTSLLPSSYFHVVPPFNYCIISVLMFSSFYSFHNILLPLILLTLFHPFFLSCCNSFLFYLFVLFPFFRGHVIA